jgi:hypothetical protein
MATSAEGQELLVDLGYLFGGCLDRVHQFRGGMSFAELVPYQFGISGQGAQQVIEIVSNLSGYASCRFEPLGSLGK